MKPGALGGDPKILVLFLKAICFMCPVGIHASTNSHSILCYEGQRREGLAPHKERIVA